VSPTLASVSEYDIPNCHEIGISFDGPGTGEGLLLGTDDGDMDGGILGNFVGFFCVSPSVGAGEKVGTSEGTSEGNFVGKVVDGLLDGLEVGDNVGTFSIVGLELGVNVGPVVVGDEVGGGGGTSLKRSSPTNKSEEGKFTLLGQTLSKSAL